MLQLGKIQSLVVRKKTALETILKTSDKEDVLLAPKDVTPDLSVGDELEVFVYKNMDNQIIATTTKPKLTLGEIALLEVCDVVDMGAFLDWGLEKDLLLPAKKQTERVYKGEKYLVGLYLNNNNKLCASMDIYNLLSSSSSYKVDDKVWGTIYEINDDIGAFVAVENKYQGLIPKKEIYTVLNYAEKIEARVTNVKKDGKLDLSIRKKAYKLMDDDATKILKSMEENDGKIFLNDHSDPEKIKKELNISKKAFKRAVGRLLKEKKIKQTDEGIEKF